MNKFQAITEAAKRKASHPELLDGYEDEFWIEEDGTRLGSKYVLLDAAHAFKVTAIDGKRVRLTRTDTFGDGSDLVKSHG